MGKYIPFSNSSEFLSWLDSNCYKCENYEDESTKEEDAKCKLAFNLELQVNLEGRVDEWVIDNIGTQSKYYDKAKQVGFCTLCSTCKKIDSELPDFNYDPSQLQLF